MAINAIHSAVQFGKGLIFNDSKIYKSVSTQYEFSKGIEQQQYSLDHISQFNYVKCRLLTLKIIWKKFMLENS